MISPSVLCVCLNLPILPDQPPIRNRSVAQTGFSTKIVGRFRNGGECYLLLFDASLRIAVHQWGAATLTALAFFTLSLYTGIGVDRATANRRDQYEKSNG
jgi:hypothetical protein